MFVKKLLICILENIIYFIFFQSSFTVSMKVLGKAEFILILILQ